MRLELTRVGLLAELANHYTTRGASPWIYIYIERERERGGERKKEREQWHVLFRVSLTHSFSLSLLHPYHRIQFHLSLSNGHHACLPVHASDSRYGPVKVRGEMKQNDNVSLRFVTKSPNLLAFKLKENFTQITTPRLETHK